MFVLFLTSCNDQNEKLIPSDRIQLSEEISVKRSSNSLPHPTCSAWNNPPGCPRCQLHTLNGGHFYFYCTNCVVYFQVDEPLSITFYTDGILEYQTLANTTVDDDPNYYYEYHFINGYNGDLEIVTAPINNIGQQESTEYDYNCF